MTHSTGGPAPADLSKVDFSAMRKLAVYFQFQVADAEGALAHPLTGRVFIEGIADIRTEEALMKIEAMLRERMPAINNLIVTNWKPLEA